MESTQAHYQVILNCQLAKGYTLEQVIDNLSILFKKDKQAIRKILSQPDFIVKSGVTIEQAKKIQKKLTKAGIGNRLHKIQAAGQSTASLPEGALITCPKCGLAQTAGNECRSCGVIFSKFGQVSPSVQPKQTKSKTPEVTLSAAWYSKGINLFIIAIIAVAMILLFTSNTTKKVIDPDKVGIKYYEIEEVRFLDDLAEPGYVTFVELFADWCKACKEYERHEKNYLTVVNPHLAIRRIDISRKNGMAIASEKYNRYIHYVPHFIIFDENGKIIADDAEEEDSGRNYMWSYKEG